LTPTVKMTGWHSGFRTAKPKPTGWLTATLKLKPTDWRTDLNSVRLTGCRMAIRSLKGWQIDWLIR